MGEPDVKLIIQPQDGIAPIVEAIRSAKKSIEIAIFRFDHKRIETALKAAAAQKEVKVTALIASVNRGGEKTLRRLETRFLGGGNHGCLRSARRPDPAITTNSS